MSTVDTIVVVIECAIIAALIFVIGFGLLAAFLAWRGRRGRRS